MGAATEQRRQNHQVPWRKNPMFSLISKALGGACDKAQPMTLREIVEMLGANPRKVGHLGISEDLLARFNAYHCFDPSAASTSVAEMLHSVVMSRRANTRLTQSRPDGKCRPALSLIGPA